MVKKASVHGFLFFCFTNHEFSPFKFFYRKIVQGPPGLPHTSWEGESQFSAGRIVGYCIAVLIEKYLSKALETFKTGKEIDLQ